MAAELESLCREVAALRERVEELGQRVGLLTPAGPAECRVAGLHVQGEAARVAEAAAADAAVTARLRAELSDPDTLAATRFEGVMRTKGDGVLSWAQSGRLSGRTGAAAPRQVGRVLSALGSEARLKLMLLLWDGGKAAPELAEGTGLRTGSLYHHMRELLAFRWIDAPQRNRYVLTQRGRQALVMAWALTQAFPSGPYPP